MATMLDVLAIGFDREYESAKAEKWHYAVSNPDWDGVKKVELIVDASEAWDDYEQEGLVVDTLDNLELEVQPVAVESVLLLWEPDGTLHTRVLHVPSKAA